MSLFNIFNRKDKTKQIESNDIWDDSLEIIPYSEQIRYRIAEKMSELKSGERFGIEDVFGESVSTDEYLEFVKFCTWYSGPQTFQTQEEFDEAISANPQDSNIQKKIANTYIAIGQPELSTEWYEKATSGGDVEAITRYAGALFYGVNIPKNITRANELCKEAIITDGFPDALLDLGLRYIHGQGVPVNFAHAFSLMERSAKQGNMAAQNNLGYLYWNGNGVSADKDKALYWYHQSANQGYEGAILYLCEYYNSIGNSSKLLNMLHIGAHFNVSQCINVLNNMR